MKYKLTIFVLITSLVILKADEKSCKFNWLFGKWISESETEIITEEWIWLSENTLEGEGKTINKFTKEVKSKESLRLLKMNGDIFYLAKVDHNLLPIAFKMTKLTSNSAVFENKNHDFPKLITYKLTANNTLKVTVSNQKRSFDVLFTKCVNDR